MLYTILYQCPTGAEVELRRHVSGIVRFLLSHLLQQTIWGDLQVEECWIWQADESSDNARGRLHVAIGQVNLDLCPTPTHTLVVLPTGSSLQPCGLVLFGAAGPLAPISRQLWRVDERELHQFKCGVEGRGATLDYLTSGLKLAAGVQLLESEFLTNFCVTY